MVNVVNGSPVADTLPGTQDSPDEIFGGDGNDSITGLGAGAGEVDQLLGEDGNDTLETSGSGFGLIEGGAGNDSIIAGASGIDTGVGGEGNDTLIGDAGSDYLAGDDYDLFGATATTVSGNDVVDGGGGDDVISGGPGDDTLSPGAAGPGVAGVGAAFDVIIGGDGNDVLALEGAPQDYQIDAGTGLLVSIPTTGPGSGVRADVAGVERIAFGVTAAQLAAGATPLTVMDFASLAPGSSNDGVGVPPIALSDTIGAAPGATQVLIDLREILFNDYDPDGGAQDLVGFSTTTPAGVSTTALLTAADVDAAGFDGALYPFGLLVVNIAGGLASPIKLQYRTVLEDPASGFSDTSSQATITINPVAAVNDRVLGSFGGETFIPYATLLANDGPGAVFGGISNAYVFGGTIVDDPGRGGIVIDFPGLFPNDASFEYSLVGFPGTALVEVDLDNSPPITTPMARVVTPGTSFFLSFDEIRDKPGNFDPDNTGLPPLVQVSGAAGPDVTYSLSATGIDLTFAPGYSGGFSLDYTLTDQPMLATSLPSTISFILAAPPAPVTVNEVLNWGINSDGRTLYQGGQPGFGEIYARELLANDLVMPGTVVGTSIDDTTPLVENLAIRSIRYAAPPFDGVTSRSDHAFGFEFDDNFTGSDTFRYDIYDPLGRSGTGLITLNVNIPQPVLTNDVVTVPIGASSVTVTAAQILGNDTFFGTGAIAQINANALITVDDSGVSIGGGKTRLDGFTFTLDPNRTLDSYQFNVLAFDTAAAGGSASGWQSVTFAPAAPTAYRFADLAETNHEGTSTVLDNGFAFRIERSGVLDEAVVFFTLRPTSSGPSADGSDVRTAFGTQLQYAFSAGEAAVNLGISIVGDALAEADESFRVTLDGLAGGNPGAIDPTAAVFVATILDDDLPLPVFTVAPLNTNVAEGTSPGAGGNLQFVINRTGDLSAAVTIGYSVGPGATNGATAEDLGGSFSSGSVNLPANVAQGFLAFAASPDALDEPDETITLTLTSTSVGTIGPQSSATITILDDDLPPPVFTVAPLNANVAEGTAPGAGGNLQFV
ncbi:Calx-beta domain-containing protein, partial [Falsiroseomonas oryzae]|uniref:Calx-beta domain-containing protein n=1 Tax=Falsiroseomonas oryzae TaxID=2766473 RepID=UPI0038CC1748